MSVLADFARRRDITFPLLSDAGSVTITDYGILNTTVASTSRIRGIPFPGTFILDRRAVVTARFFEQNYQERETAASILTRLGSDGSRSAALISAPSLTRRPHSLSIPVPDCSSRTLSTPPHRITTSSR